MGLTLNSTGKGAIDNFKITKNTKNSKIIAIAGNPNVGKSTVFNALTGMNQHTGNWPGKTVSNATGYCNYKGNSYVLVDIPGTYSLFAHSPEEEIARNYICFEKPADNRLLYNIHQCIIFQPLFLKAIISRKDVFSDFIKQVFALNSELERNIQKTGILRKWTPFMRKAILY